MANGTICNRKPEQKMNFDLKEKVQKKKFAVIFFATGRTNIVWYWISFYWIGAQVRHTVMFNKHTNTGCQVYCVLRLTFRRQRLNIIPNWYFYFVSLCCFQWNDVSIVCFWIKSICVRARVSEQTTDFNIVDSLPRRFQLVTFFTFFAHSLCHRFGCHFLLRIKIPNFLTFSDHSFWYSFHKISNFCRVNSQELIIQQFWHFFIWMKTYKFRFSSKYVFVF